MLTHALVDPDNRRRSSRIEGYASKPSVRPGESLKFKVSTRPASPFTIDIYRTGYYQGTGGRHMTRLGRFEGFPQEDPPVGEARLRACTWETSAELTILADWLSGVLSGTHWSTTGASVCSHVASHRLYDVWHRTQSNVRPPTPRVAWQSVARAPGHRAKRFSALSFSARSRSARRFSPGESVPRRQGATHPSLGVPEGFLHLRCAPNAHPAQLRRFLFR